MPLSRRLALALTTVALSLGLAVSGPGAAVAAPAHPQADGQQGPAGPSTHRGEHHSSGWYRLGTVPLNVARICTWTWMCTKADDHPNDTGYDVIGQTIVAALEQ